MARRLEGRCAMGKCEMCHRNAVTYRVGAAVCRIHAGIADREVRDLLDAAAVAEVRGLMLPTV